VKTAWKGNSSESTVHRFKKCYTSNSMDGTEDDIIWKVGDSTDNTLSNEKWE
jgi:hypothetical protein